MKLIIQPYDGVTPLVQAVRNATKTIDIASMPRSGMASVLPNLVPMLFSMAAMPAATWASSAAG